MSNDTKRLEQAIFDLRAEVERNRLRTVTFVHELARRGESPLAPGEHKLHGGRNSRECCNPDCGGAWGVNCNHCHRLDHRCGSDLNPEYP